MRNAELVTEVTVKDDDEDLKIRVSFLNRVGSQTMPTTLMILKSYREMYDLVLRDRIEEQRGREVIKNRLIRISGNPGIGKSCFLLYMISVLLRVENAEILYCVAKDNVCYYMTQSSCRVFHGVEAALEHVPFQRANAYYLHDSHKDREPPSILLLSFKKVVLVSSPLKENFKNFDKLMGNLSDINVYYLSPWSLNELRCCQLISFGVNNV
jgi:hypothetical protein